MHHETPKNQTDEMTSALRKAFVETGVIIPTTPGEVRLAQSALERHVTQEQLDAAFAKLEDALDNGSSVPFMELDKTTALTPTRDLSMAARNGEELDAKTLSRIEESIARATRKPPQS